jgi:phosphoethanolamine N-methyltransferase
MIEQEQNNSESATHADEYHPALVAMLELLWGEGFLSPGGEAAVDAIVAGLDLQDRLVLDIGCGLGGCALVLARKYGAQVIGLDVEAPLIEEGQERVAGAGLSDRVDLRLTTPGPLPLPDAAVDVVFGKDSWLHIPDKRAFFAEIRRVLKPGGILAASDWLRSERQPYGDDMRYFFKMEGLTYHLDTLDNYAAILQKTGFVEVKVVDTSSEYQRLGNEEYRRIQGPMAARIVELLGPERQAYYVENWRALTVVLNAGDLRTARLQARKPL